MPQDAAVRAHQVTFTAPFLSCLPFPPAAARTAGLTPLYLIGRYGGGVSAQQFGDGWTNTTWLNYYLNLPLPGIRTSLVTLTVAADDVALTVNRSPAEILSVQVCDCVWGGAGGGLGS